MVGGLYRIVRCHVFFRVCARKGMYGECFVGWGRGFNEEKERERGVNLCTSQSKGFAFLYGK